MLYNKSNDRVKYTNINILFLLIEIHTILNQLIAIVLFICKNNIYRN